MKNNIKNTESKVLDNTLPCVITYHIGDKIVHFMCREATPLLEHEDVLRKSALLKISELRKFIDQLNLQLYINSLNASQQALIRLTNTLPKCNVLLDVTLDEEEV